MYRLKNGDGQACPLRNACVGRLLWQPLVELLRRVVATSFGEAGGEAGSTDMLMSLNLADGGRARGKGELHGHDFEMAEMKKREGSLQGSESP